MFNTCYKQHMAEITITTITTTTTTTTLFQHRQRSSVQHYNQAFIENRE